MDRQLTHWSICGCSKHHPCKAIIRAKLTLLDCDPGSSAHSRRLNVSTQDRQLRADIYLPQMVVGGVGRGLCIDVSRVHDFHGNAANPSQNGTLRHADINHVLSHRGDARPDARVHACIRTT